MPRTARKAPGGVVFHALNRGVGRRTLFHKDEDFAAFERILEQALSIVPVRLLSYCLMPNHWHLLLWPRAEGDLGRFMQRLTTAHVRRWQAHYHEVGLGHLYQGRFKSFPVQEDAHFLTVARYVERNPLRANLVPQAQAWRWSSLRRREHGSAQERGLLSEWPVARSADWLAWVNEPQTDAELLALRNSITKGTPYGEPAWRERMVEALGLHASLRHPGRPKTRPAAAGARKP
jgi:putative transposase